MICTTSVNCFLLSSASTADVSQVWPGMDQSFTKEVEDEANSYFQRIYNHPPNPTISIDEVLEMLKKFKDSPVKKERVSKCNIKLKKIGFWFNIKAKDCTVCIAQYFISNSRDASTFLPTNDHYLHYLPLLPLLFPHPICSKRTEGVGGGIYW